MIRRIGAALLAAFAFVLVSLMAELGVEYLTRDRGVVGIGNPLQVAEQIYVPMTITNYGSHTLDGIRLAVPLDTGMAEIVSSQSVASVTAAVCR